MLWEKWIFVSNYSYQKLGDIKKIGAISSLVIYFMAIGLNYVTSFESSSQKTNGSDWFELNDLKDHYNHTVPVKFSLAIQVKPSAQPFPTGETQIWTYQQTQSFYFDQLFSRLSSDMLNLLIEQKKADLLYSFHFFLLTSD